MKEPFPAGVQGIKNTTIHDDGEGGKVFVTEHGGIGMEIHGRISIHSIDAWIAMSWRDIPEKTQRVRHASQFDHSACDHRPESRNCGFDKVPEPKCHCTGSQAHHPTWVVPKALPDGVAVANDRTVEYFSDKTLPQIDDDDLPFGR